MGNHRFRLSDMMPNAWFYKLKDMNKPHRKQSTKKTNNISPKPSTAQKPSVAPPLIPNRASYYFPSNSPIHHKANDTHFPLDSPRKSTRMPRNRKPTAASSSSLSSSCRGSLSLSVSESESDNNNCCICKKVAPSSSDIVLDIGSELELRPIITKPIKKQEQDTDIKNSPARRSVSLRSWANTPTKKVRIAARSSGSNNSRRKRTTTRGIAESFAVVKSSSDPKKDFKESMMEMILENDLKTAKELEELLACYLSLNANEYHDVIVKVFGEIWFDIIRK